MLFPVIFFKIPVDVLLEWISTAHNAPPMELVNMKNMLMNGIDSSNNATIPNPMYAPVLCL